MKTGRWAGFALCAFLLAPLLYGQEFDGSIRLPESDADFTVNRSMAAIDADGHQQVMKDRNTRHLVYLTTVDGKGILTAIPPIKSCDPSMRVTITVQGVKAHHEWKVVLDHNSCQADGLMHWKVGDKIDLSGEARRVDDDRVPSVFLSEGSGRTMNRSRDWTGQCGVGNEENIKECKSRE